MKRVRMTVAYDGTDYAGWQLQPNGVSIQEVLEKALRELTGEAVRVHGASRTDAGVHALGQVAHFDTGSTVPPDRFSYALNTILPPDIRVQSSEEAPKGFHSRFWSVGKEYSYTIQNGKHENPLLRRTSWFVSGKLDTGRMREFLGKLKGTHDFKAFCASGSEAKTTVRTVDRILLKEEEDRITVTIHGNDFLYNIVRIITGTAVYTGLGKLEPDIAERMLETGDRRIGGPTAPAKGLVLLRVEHADRKPDWVLPEND